MKVLYIVKKNRSYDFIPLYRMYENGFNNKFNTTVVDFSKKIDVKNFDMIVLGHNAFGILFPVRYRKKWDIKLSNTYEIIKNIRNSGCVKIMFSTNDCEYLAHKRKLAELIKADLIITHSVNAGKEFMYNGNKALFITYGIDKSVVFNMNIDRNIVLGFRASSMWRNMCEESKQREQFNKSLSADTFMYKRDLSLGKNFSNFLEVDEYVKWLNRCKLVGGTVSANNIITPRFIESMACGCVPIAPKHDYECLLNDSNYIPVESMSDIPHLIDRFLNDSEYKDNLINNCSKTVERNSIDDQIDFIMEKVT